MPAAAAIENGGSAPQQGRGMQARSDGLEQTLDAQRRKHRRLRMAVQASEQGATAIVDKLKKTKDALEAKIEQSRKLNADIADLEAGLQEDRKLLAALTRAAYLGGDSWIRFALGRRDAERAGRMLAYYDYFNRMRIARIAGITESLQELNAMRQTMHLDLERLRVLERSYLELLDQYIEQRGQREEVVEDLARHLAGRDLESEALEEHAAGLRALVARLKRRSRPARSGQESFQALQGKLNWPLQGRLENRFGAPRQEGLLRWDGVLIAAEAGDPVRAVGDGRVVYSNWFHSLGLLVILDHGDGYMSLYGHNEQVAARKGRRVRAGEVIAYAGDSGGRSEFGLYFEIRHNGVPLDPTHWCREAPDA